MFVFKARMISRFPAGDAADPGGRAEEGQGQLVNPRRGLPCRIIYD